MLKNMSITTRYLMACDDFITNDCLKKLPQLNYDLHNDENALIIRSLFSLRNKIMSNYQRLLKLKGRELADALYNREFATDIYYLERKRVYLSGEYTAVNCFLNSINQRIIERLPAIQGYYTDEVLFNYLRRLIFSQYKMMQKDAIKFSEQKTRYPFGVFMALENPESAKDKFENDFEMCKFLYSLNDDVFRRIDTLKFVKVKLNILAKRVSFACHNAF